MKYTRVFAFLALAGMAGSATATNGYFSHGYGMKSKGMAGVSTTSTDDAFGGANNPAAMAFAGNRFDLGMDVFSPRREASMDLGGGMVLGAESDSNYFLVPELGYAHQVNNQIGVGVTVYGNGGMNTDYPEVMPGMNMFMGSGSLGVDLMQLIVAPTAAYKVAPNHSIGVAPLLGYQRFEAKGLQGFCVDTNGCAAGGDNLGSDDAMGYGVRVGYLGKITPTVTIGAAYATKMDFEEFDTYKNLFAEHGDFDIPANWNLGVSWQVTPALRLALDYQGIQYSDVNSVGNAVMSPGNPGDSDGLGFGWDDIEVIKLAVEHKFSKALTLRAGYSHTDSPIVGDMTCATATNCGEAMLNILAPAVIEDHVTLGFTYTLGSGDELTMAYMHAFENEVSGVGLFGETDTIKMYQDSIGIQYSWKM